MTWSFRTINSYTKPNIISNPLNLGCLPWVNLDFQPNSYVPLTPSQRPLNESKPLQTKQ